MVVYRGQVVSDQCQGAVEKNSELLMTLHHKDQHFSDLNEFFCIGHRHGVMNTLSYVKMCIS